MDPNEKTPVMSETFVESIKDQVVETPTSEDDDKSLREGLSKTKQDWSQRTNEEMERPRTSDDGHEMSFPAAAKVVNNLVRSVAQSEQSQEPERSGEILNSTSDESMKRNHNTEEPSKGDGIIKIITDDADVPRYVRSKRDLPLNRYTSLGVIVDTKGFAKTPVIVSVPHKTYMSGRPVLTPVPPEKETGLGYESKSHSSLKQDAPVIFDDIMPKLGPLALATAPRAGQVPPPLHEGVVWPLTWARKPPYVTPAYHRSGAKQPIGTVQAARVPAKPSKAVINGKRLMLPTWISPLYKPYGIGGPFGPNGPFYEPPFLTDEEPPIPPEKPVTQRCFLSRWVHGLLEDWKKKDKDADERVLAVEAQLAQIKQIVKQESHQEEKISHVEQNLSTLLKDIQTPES